MREESRRAVVLVALSCRSLILPVKKQKQMNNKKEVSSECQMERCNKVGLVLSLQSASPSWSRVCCGRVSVLA